MLPTNRPSSEASKSRLARVIHWCFRDQRTGQLAVIQMPNLPLMVFIVLSVVRTFVHSQGAAVTAVSVVAGAALIWWAGEEIVRGDSRFRRALGAVVLLAFVARLMMK